MIEISSALCLICVFSKLLVYKIAVTIEV